MKVLMQNRTNYLSSLAGDSIQMLKTRDYLTKLGLTVRVSSAQSIDLRDYNIIHLFNVIPIEETYQQLKNAKRQRKKIILSPIFWDPKEYLKETNQTEKFEAWWRKTMPLRQEVLDGVNLILPTSYLELEMIKRFFRLLPPALIVPNAADRMFSLAKPDRFIQRFQCQDFVLCVGRFCPQKNQLNLIKAVKELRLPLVLIGGINDIVYYQECRKESSGGNIKFIDEMNQEDLASAYAAARVHALVSWYDIPGLVSLEAALAGCNIVSTDRGSPREYFGDLAFYCDPSIDSIVKALKEAWHTPKSSILKEKVLNNFTWEHTAQATYQAYQRVLLQR